MNILILANKMPYPTNDGGAIATLSLAMAMSELGHDITILAMNTSKHSYDIEKIPKQITSKVKFSSVYVDTSIKPPELLVNLMFSRLPYNAKRFISNSYKQKLVSILRNEQFDLVQLEGLYLYPYINTIRKHFDGLISFRAHNIEHEIWRRSVKNQKQSVKRMYMSVLSKRLEKFEVESMNKFDLLVPITERDAHILEFLGNNSAVCVTPVGIDKDAYKFEAPDLNKHEIAFLGSLDWLPNQEGLFWFLDKVWPIIISENKNIKLHIAGRNAPTNFKHRIHSENVEFHGQVDNAMDYLKKYPIMIAPLLSGSGMRVKIIEGMAIGRIVCTTAIGAEGIDAEDKKNIFIDNSHEDMAHTILNIFKNPESSIQIAKNAREFIENRFDNEIIASKLIDFYKFQISKHL